MYRLRGNLAHWSSMRFVMIQHTAHSWLLPLYREATDGHYTHTQGIAMALVITCGQCNRVWEGGIEWISSPKNANIIPSA